MADTTAPTNVRIAEALRELEAAQQELLNVLEDVEIKDRADKTIIGTALRDVLDKVTTAKRKLDAIG
jgi:hypothetical protein